MGLVCHSGALRYVSRVICTGCEMERGSLYTMLCSHLYWFNHLEGKKTVSVYVKKQDLFHSLSILRVPLPLIESSTRPLGLSR